MKKMKSRKNNHFSTLDNSEIKLLYNYNIDKGFTSYITANGIDYLVLQKGHKSSNDYVRIPLDNLLGVAKIKYYGVPAYNVLFGYCFKFFLTKIIFGYGVFLGIIVFLLAGMDFRELAVAVIFFGGGFSPLIMAIATLILYIFTINSMVYRYHYFILQKRHELERLEIERLEQKVKYNQEKERIDKMRLKEEQNIFEEYDVKSMKSKILKGGRMK